jgi:predicted acetyltransferase
LTVRELGHDDIEQVSRLSQLSFGYRSETAPSELRGMFGIDGADGRLAAMARVRSYEQLWGGRRVRMGGIASVAVHPDARGQGHANVLMRSLLPLMRSAAQPISALFPTGVGVYRPVGWEVVGSLDDTRIATRDLQPAGPPGAVQVRSAGLSDAATVAALYAGLGLNGLLTRDGEEFPSAEEALLEHDVVALAELDGSAVGYATYARGSGYREGSELRLRDFVHRSAPAAGALLRSLASWSTVAPTVLWRGPTTGLGLHLSRAVPPPVQSQPWMLRIVDAVAAVAQRGFLPDVDADSAFVLFDPDVADHCRPWRLRVTGGSGVLEELTPAADLPVLHVRGLALLYAGAADVAALLRAGLIDRPVPGLDAAFSAAQLPQILDYF